MISPMQFPNVNNVSINHIQGICHFFFPFWPLLFTFNYDPVSAIEQVGAFEASAKISF